MPRPLAEIPLSLRIALTYAQAGALLGVSRQTIERMVARGDLRRMRVHDGSTRIARVELERYASTQMDQA